MTYVPLSYGGLALAATLILLSGVLSVAFRLGLERNLLVAALRMIVQLTAVGFILKTIFDQASPLWTALFAAVMLAATGYEARRRQERRIEGWQALLLGASVPFMAGLVATVFAVTAVIGAEPWYAPRYLLPLLGMMAGNALAGVSLVLDTMTTTASRERVAIEARTRTRRLAFRGVRACHTPQSGHRPHADPERHVGVWPGFAPRNDDRTNSRRRRSCRGNKVSDHDYVPDRGIDSSRCRGEWPGGRSAPDGSPPQATARSSWTFTPDIMKACAGHHEKRRLKEPPFDHFEDRRA